MCDEFHRNLQFLKKYILSYAVKLSNKLISTSSPNMKDFKLSTIIDHTNQISYSQSQNWLVSLWR